MADWSNPQTWRDTRKFTSVLAGLVKRLDQAQRQGRHDVDPAVVHDLVAVLSGHQQTLIDLGEVAGKMAVYTIKTHAARDRENRALAEVVKAIHQVTKTGNQLAKRVDRLERAEAKRREAKKK